MPELNPQLEQFKKELDDLVRQLSERIKKGGFSRVELAQIVAQVDFLEELNNLGFEEIVNKYFNGYDDVLAGIIKTAEQQGVRFAGVNLDALMSIKELDKKYLLKSASAWSTQYESALVKSLIRGDTITQTVKSLVTEVPLTTPQLSTVLNTQYADFNRTATREIYSDEPEQRFQYVGGVIPTSSQQCAWLMANQRKDGYTADEISTGIETPFGIINWRGRDPNFNCIHAWEPIYD